MKITLTGASGFLGGRLVAKFAPGRGHALHLLGRSKPKENVGFSPWDAVKDDPPREALEGAEAADPPGRRAGGAALER